MATRANIIVQTGPKTFKVIYTHSDGYPDWMGVYLDRFHNSEAAAKEIVKLGDLSVLDARLAPADGEPHEFEYDKRAPFCSVFYGRDREPGKHKAATASTLEEAIALTGHYAVYAWLKGKGWVFCLSEDLTSAGPLYGLRSLTGFLQTDPDCQERIDRLDEQGMDAEWRDAGCPSEKVSDASGFTQDVARPIGWVKPLTAQQVMAQRYLDEAVF